MGGRKIKRSKEEIQEIHKTLSEIFKQ